MAGDAGRAGGDAGAVSEGGGDPSRRSGPGAVPAEGVSAPRVGAQFLAWLAVGGPVVRGLVGMAPGPASSGTDAGKPFGPTGPTRSEDLDAQGALFDPALQSSLEEALQRPSGQGQNQAEAQNVGQYPRGQEEGTAHEDREAVQKRLAWQLAHRQLPLNREERPETLLPSQGGAYKPGRNHQGDGGPKADPLSHPQEEGQLKERHGDEQEDQPTQQEGRSFGRGSGRSATGGRRWGMGRVLRHIPNVLSFCPAGAPRLPLKVRIGQTGPGFSCRGRDLGPILLEKWPRLIHGRSTRHPANDTLGRGTAVHPRLGRPSGRRESHRDAARPPSLASGSRRRDRPHCHGIVWRNTPRLARIP